MEIRLKNTLTKHEEVFKPVHKNRVGIYHCGPTVYSEQHLGNLSGFIYSDVLARMFEYQGYKVNRVVNITDVGHLVADSDDGEDKMEKAARESGNSAKEVAETFTKKFMEDLEAVDIDISKIIFPKATDHIEEQIKLIQKLEEKGFTYKTSDGVYFDTKKFSTYGKLGQIDLEGLKEGARIAENSEKKNPTDFALWKFSTKDEQRQQEWSSPWGVGFPGWHIECSAMSRKYLGETFDIHLGGIEHIPIHHNNEIAQSEAAFEKPLANYWMHINHLMLDGQKLAKSEGHVVFLREFSEKNIRPEIFRYWMLTSNYSASSNFTWEAILAANTAVEKIILLIQKNKLNLIDRIFKKANPDFMKSFLKEINNDLNTAGAIARLWEMINDTNISAKQKVVNIFEADKILGINFQKISELSTKKDIVPSNIKDIAKKREEARKNKDFAAADKLRDEARAFGYEIIDVKQGEFEIKKTSK